MTPVIWHIGRMLCNDHAFLNETLSGHEYVHYSNEWPTTIDGAIVVVPARLALDDVEFLNARISVLKWVIIFLIGDEESLFPIDGLKHPKMKIWVMSPVRGKHEPPRFVINGSQPKLHEILSACSKQKTLDWFFAGQITHSRRRECAEQLRNRPNGLLLETAGFMQGMPYPEYLQNMASAKFIPCPSGPIELSTARIFEALEAHCVPIVDGQVPLENVGDRLRSNSGAGYWEWFFQTGTNELPFPIIYDWRGLPNLIENLLPDFNALSRRCFEWWSQYKKDFRQNIERDVQEISK